MSINRIFDWNGNCMKILVIWHRKFNEIYDASLFILWCPKCYTSTIGGQWNLCYYGCIYCSVWLILTSGIFYISVSVILEIEKYLAVEENLYFIDLLNKRIWVNVWIIWDWIKDTEL